MTVRRKLVVVAGVAALAIVVLALPENTVVARVQAQQGLPAFQVDPSWAKPLPNNWVMGTVSSVAVDSRDHVWALHRPKQVPAADIKAGKTAAPPVVEFDPQGNFVQAWGGPGAGYSWPEDSFADYPRGNLAEHGIFVDYKDNVWVTGNGDVVLKFTRAGKFLMQIGELFKTAGSNDTKLLGNPTDMAVDPATNEVFVSDGYLNRRVIVFDADTGTYKRHWGAYGKRPDDGPAVNYEPDKPLPQQFFALHCVVLSKDGFVYACDRQRNRVQVFRKDGTFVREAVVAKDTPAGAGIITKGPTTGPGSAEMVKGGTGSVFRMGFSADPQQEYLYAAGNSKIYILRRRDLQVLGSFDVGGTHHMAGADSKGNLFITGRRSPEKVQFKGVPGR